MDAPGEEEMENALRELYATEPENEPLPDLTPDAHPQVLGHARKPLKPTPESGSGKGSRFMNQFANRAQGRLTADLKNLEGEQLTIKLTSLGIPQRIADLILRHIQSQAPWEEKTLPVEAVLMLRQFQRKSKDPLVGFQKWILNYFVHYGFKIGDDELSAACDRLYDEPEDSGET